MPIVEKKLKLTVDDTEYVMRDMVALLRELNCTELVINKAIGGFLKDIESLASESFELGIKHANKN
jgi:hypothetical protein